MQQFSKVTSKYQATIPLAVRRKLSLKPGDAVVFEIENDTITVVFGVYNVNKQLRIAAPKRLPAVIAKQQGSASR